MGVPVTVVGVNLGKVRKPGRFHELRILVLQMAADDLGILEHVKRLEKQQLKARRLDPINVSRKSRDHRNAGLINKFSYGGWLSKRAAGAEMDDPVCKPTIHHRRQFRQLHAVPVEVDAPGRAMKSEIKNAVVAFTQQVKVVLKLFAGVAGEVAEF